MPNLVIQLSVALGSLCNLGLVARWKSRQNLGWMMDSWLPVFIYGRLSVFRVCNGVFLLSADIAKSGVLQLTIWNEVYSRYTMAKTRHTSIEADFHLSAQMRSTMWLEADLIQCKHLCCFIA